MKFARMMKRLVATIALFMIFNAPAFAEIKYFPQGQSGEGDAKIELIRNLQVGRLPVSYSTFLEGYQFFDKGMWGYLVNSDKDEATVSYYGRVDRDKICKFLIERYNDQKTCDQLRKYNKLVVQVAINPKNALIYGVLIHVGDNTLEMTSPSQYSPIIEDIYGQTFGETIRLLHTTGYIK